MIKKIYIIILVVLGASCSVKNSKRFIFSLENINTDGILSHKKQLNYANRFQLIISGKNQTLVNLSKSNSLQCFDLQTGSYREMQITTLTGQGEPDAIYYGDKSMEMLFEGNMIRYSYETMKTDTMFQIHLSPEEFVIHNMYAPSIQKHQRKYLLQYGNATRYNRVDSYALIAADGKTQERLINYPEEFGRSYIHYNDICTAFYENMAFYCFATIPAVYKKDLISDKKSRTGIENEGFLQYDTTRLNDMKYVYDYTYKTKYNVKLFVTDNYLLLIQKERSTNNNYSPGKSPRLKYKLTVLDHKLKILESHNISHHVDPNFIFLQNQQLIFLSLSNKKKFVYDFL
jgi:hypothetical protein